MAQIPQVIRIGDTLTNLIDSVTGESVNYNKVETWYDGETPMSDDLVDGRVYRRAGAEYFQMAFDSGRPKSLHVNSVSDIRSLSYTELLFLALGYYNSIITKGYHTPADGGGAEYTPVFDAGLSDDGFRFIKPTNPLVPEIIFQAILGDTLNVKTAGARGNGVDDDRVAIQTVINYVTTSSRNRVIFFPKGVYLIASSENNAGLTVAANSGGTDANAITFMGENIGSIIRAGTSMGHLIRFPNATRYFKAEQMTFDGNSMVSYTFSSGDTFSNSAFYECRFNNANLDGLSIDTWVCTLSHCRADGNNRHGFHFGLNNTSTVLLNCYASDNGDRASLTHNGYYFENARYTSLISCACDRSATAYRFDTAYSVGLYNCGTEAASRCLLVNNGGNGISVDNFYFLGFELPVGASMAPYLFHFINTQNVTIRGYYEAALPVPPTTSRLGGSSGSSVRSIDGSLTYSDASFVQFTDFSRIITSGSGSGGRPTTELVNGRLYYDSSVPRLEVYHQSTGQWVSAQPNASPTRRGLVLTAAASADSATAPGTTYSQAEVQGILTELRDLKAKMRTAGLLAT